MRRTRLQRLAILHHRFDGVAVIATGEPFIGSFLAFETRYGQIILIEIIVNAEHLDRIALRVFQRFKRVMPFLPQEFRRAQEQARAHFPPHDVAPLVQQQSADHDMTAPTATSHRR